MLQKTTNHNSRGEFNPFAPQGAGGAFTYSEASAEAIVVDVVVNDSHPEYAKDGYNIGAIQFRMVQSNFYREQGTLNWALPMDANLTEYPLLQEIVIVTKALNRFYYTKKLNTSSRVTAQPLYGLNEELSPPDSPSKKISTYNGSTANPKKDDSSAKNKLGKYFKDIDAVKRLRHDEGDVVLEGRSGQSIRMGAAWKKGTLFKSVTDDQRPNMLFRVGQSPKETPSVEGLFGLVSEDVNGDATSLWLVSDQIVPLELSTAKNPVHKASVADFPKRLEGSQLIINTDQFVVNTKKEKILGNSLNGIHWTTNKDFTVDSGQDYVSRILRDEKITVDQNQAYEIKQAQYLTVGQNQISKIGTDQTATIGGVQDISVGSNAVFKIGGYFESTVGDRISLVAPKVYLGTKQSEAQPVVLGAVLAEFLSEFLDAHITNAAKHVITPVGPGALSPTVVAKLIQLKVKVSGGASAPINSQVTFTG